MGSAVPEGLRVEGSALPERLRADGVRGTRKVESGWGPWYQQG
jgi:hypothetical protein